MRPIDAAQPGLPGFNPTEEWQDQPTHLASARDISKTGGTVEQSSTQSADPFLRFLMQVSVHQNDTTAPALEGSGRNGFEPGVLYFDGSAPAGPATKQAGIKAPPEVEEVLADGAKNPKAKVQFTTAQQALATGDYTKAYQAMESLMRNQGEDVLTDNEVKSAQSIRDQLGFLSDMQKAGRRADYPPTESQLVSYFKTLKGDPEAARQAFATYAESFHVQPADVPGEKSDIRYAETKVSRGQTDYTTNEPRDWSDISNRPAKGAPFAGRQMSDCKGYAFMAEKLLGAAGFKVAHHITAQGSGGIGHAMVTFTHPNEKGYTITSNYNALHDDKEKDLVKKAYEGVVGKLTGKEHYYAGKTQSDAAIECTVKGHEL